MTTDLRFPFGSVSHGTHRPDDLVVGFRDAAVVLTEWLARNSLDPDASADLWRRFQFLDEEFATHRRMHDKCLVLWDMQDLLDEFAVPFDAYFGSHPGDGSDFGFWSVLD